MGETLGQLGGLLLGSVPTILLLLLLYVLYRGIVHKALSKVLAERRARTVGAMEKARADIAAAEARAGEYEQRLREARAAVFQAQEAKLRLIREARMSALAAARVQAQEQVKQARTAIEQDKVEAQAGLQAESARLAAEIVRTVLRPVAGQAPAGGAE